ncbi:MAG TPA: isocitrate lyase/PEP mutase family protein [Candidatus Binatus sp.]|uniref:isocitrate lyase/PEP mutase family protein n=1 Tax=Candidatus Binatus sp. TaxID=2811406 RepID=UPI002B472432|nr:isocitrate lyase/PEP mutase family protein [Candidatus Binatus sp.]HKN13509.1 isocitrate lyase/PEP mutase family protein [Candidatus Binatus sp.]
MNEQRSRLRDLLAGPEMIVAPFVFDCIQAKLAAAAGFDAVYMTGFGTAAARGYPDLGLLTMSEMVANARAISRSVNVPVICDADTGYGNPLNVWRTVREYEDAGASALHIEDQVFPKRCGFLAGKQVIAMEAMVPKVRAACDARRDRNLVIIARTDALQPNGWDDVVRRARAYRDAGADLLFVDGIKTLDDLKRYAEKLGELPLIYNGDLLPIDELKKYPFKITIHIGTMLAAFDTMRAAMTELKRTGKLSIGTGSNVFEDFVRTMGVAEYQALEKKYTD